MIDMISNNKAEIKETASIFVRKAKTLLNEKGSAKPAICYHLRNFTFIEDLSEGNPYPSAECIFNRETLTELVTDYTETMAIFIMSETLEYILMEKEVFFQ